MNIDSLLAWFFIRQAQSLPKLTLLICGIVATFSGARAGSIAQSVAFPVTNQAVTLTISADLLGSQISVAGPLGTSELTPDGQGQVVWVPARYGKYTLTCGDATHTIWVTARPMKFHWWDCTTAQKNVTEVMQRNPAWQARGVTRVDWTGGDYLAAPENGGYTTAQQWYDNWSYAYNTDGMAIDEMWCEDVARTNAMLQAISMVRQASGPTYSINVWSAGFGSNFAAGAANFKANNVTVLIEDYYGGWSNHKARWDAVRSYGLQNQAISGIWPGNTNLTNEAEVRADVALVRLAAPEANGIAIFAPTTAKYTPKDLSILLNDCDRAIEDYYLKPLIHLSVNASAQLVAWNLGNEDAAGFAVQLLNGAGSVVQTIDLSALVANGKQTIALPAGAVNAKVVNPAGTANLYTGNSQYSNGLFPVVVPGRYTWTNANEDNKWSTSSSWNPSGPPPGNIDSGNYAYFDGSVSAPTSVTAPSGEVSISSVQFTSAGWTINGSATTQDFYTYGISSAGTGTNTINIGISARDVVPASFTVGQNNTLVMNGLIGAVRNNGGLVKSGAGTLTATYANTYTGATNVNAGKFSVRNMSSWVSNPVNIASGARFDIDLGNAMQNPAGPTVFSGAGLLTLSSGHIKMGPSGANLVNLQAGGQLDVQGGTFEIGWNRNTMGGNLGSMNVATGAFYYNSDAAASVDALTGSGVIGNAYNANVLSLTVGISGTTNNATYGVSGNTANFSGVIRDQETYNGVMTANTSLAKAGSGTQILSGTNTYHGPTTINGGTLQIGGSGRLGGGAYAGAIENSGSFEFASSANQTLGGIISGTGNLTLSGPGTLSLSATNTYSGSTTINGGTLNVTGSISNSSVTVTNGGSLAGNGTTGAVTVSAGGTIAPGVAGVGSLHLNNKALSLSGAANLTINAATGASAGIVNISAVTYGGTLKVTNVGGTFTDGQTFTLFSAGTYSGSFSTIKLPALPDGLFWDSSNLLVSGTISVSATGTQVFTSMEVTPAVANLGSGATQQFSSAACDQYGNPMPSQPSFTWSLAGSGTLDSSGFYTSPNTAGTATVTATTGEFSGTASITVTNAAPTVTTAAAASPAAVSGSTTSLSMLGADTDGGGEQNLIYTWEAASIPSGATAPVFSENGTNASKNTTATFSSAGAYTFNCTITDLGSASTTSSVNVSVNQTPDLITVTPATASLPSGATVQLAATATDQFGSPLNNSSLTWTVVSGIGSVSATGLYTAPIGSSGSATVRASAGGVSDTATLTVTPVVTGVWANPAGGSWITRGNWQGGGIPSGNGVTADFSTLTLTANATVTLDGAKTIGNLYFGGTAPYGWILNSGSGGPLTLTATGTTPVIQVNNQTAAIGAVVSGTQGFLKTGIGTLALSQPNSLSGQITISQGTVQISNNTALGSGTITIGDANTGSANLAWLFQGAGTPSNAITVTNLGTGTVTLGTHSAGNNTNPSCPLTLNRPVTLHDGTVDRTSFTGKISGPVGTITLTGTRVTFGNSTNDFVGNILVSDGTFYQNNAAGSLPDATAVTLNGSSSRFRMVSNASETIGALNGNGIVENATGSGNTLTIGGGDASGTFSGTLTDGSGMLNFAKTGLGPQTLSGANTYTGTTTINGGTLQITGSGTLGDGTYAGAISNIGTFEFASSSNQTLSGVISGTGTLIQAGNGTLTLSGNNSYSGATTLNGGKLLVNGSLGNTATTVAAAGSLGGTGSLAGAVTLNGTLAPGANGIGNLTINNALTLAGGSQLAWEINNWTGMAGTGWDQATVASLNLTASTANPITIRLMDSALTNFTETDASFVLVQTTSGISGFSADKFTVDTSGLSLPKGNWAIQQAGNNLVLAYTANPDANANGILDDWETAHFGNSSAGANRAGADADHDGISNLLEYALNCNPLVANASPLTMDQETVADAKHLRLAVTKNPAATNLIFTVECCGALNDWSAANTIVEVNTPTQLIVRDNVPMASEPRRFIRLRVQTAQ